jgi:signal transduction histidine kinase
MGDAVRDTVDRCERLIESLLMLARSEAATGGEEPVDLAAIATYCITDLHSRSEHAGVTVDDHLEPCWTRGEPGLLERMIANLIDNAIRHNIRGGFLMVSTRSVGGRALIRVANSGPQIDPAAAESLSEPFRRLDRAVGGLGLGLSIVRSVAEAHGGALALSARDAGGLDVLVELPAIPAPEGSPYKQTPRALMES